MNCCFSPNILTRAEREAIARLREQRAAGKAPVAAAHRAPHYSHPDPIVTFYTNPANTKPLPPLKPRPPRNVKLPPPRPIKPAAAIRSKPIPRTAHQKKKVVRHATKRARPDPTPQHSGKIPPAGALVDKIRNANVWDAFTRTHKTTDTNAAPSATTTAPSTDNKENSIHRFKAATKKRFEGVKNRFANNSPSGERFVLQQTPTADPSESNNDRYFQDLMMSDS